MALVAVTGTLAAQQLDANYFYSEAVRNVEMFLDTAREIQDAKEWKDKHSNWQAYCAEFMPVSAGRIRQMNIARNEARLIENVSGLTPIESKINWMKDIISIEDRHMMPSVYKYAHQLTDGEPAKRHINAAYEVEKELAVTGTISVNGDSLPPSALNRLAAHKEAVMEVDKRYDEHRKGGNKRQKLTVSFQIIKDNDGRMWQALPQTFPLLKQGEQYTFYRDKDDNDE